MRILSLIIFMGLFQLIMAQEGRFTNSYEIELQNAIFDEAFGIMAKANHWWYIGTSSTPKSSKATRLQTSLAFHAMAAPGTSPRTSGELQEFTARFLLRAHVGVERDFFAKGRGYGFLSAYVGLNSILIDGNLNQSSQGFDRGYTTFQVYGDFGSRFGIGYRVTEKLGIQLSLTNSWLHIDNPLGTLPGLLFWGPDALALGSIGVNYRL